MTATVLNAKLLLLQDDTRRREQLDVKDTARRLGHTIVIGDVGGIPDGLALEVGGVVEVEPDTLLRTETVEIDHVAGKLLNSSQRIRHVFCQQQGGEGNTPAIDDHGTEMDGRRLILHEDVTAHLGDGDGTVLAYTAHSIKGGQAVDDGRDGVGLKLVRKEQDAALVLRMVYLTQGFRQRFAPERQRHGLRRSGRRRQKE